MKIMVETSARHIHLTQEDLDTLFGKDYQLTPKKDLSQPGQFACAEKVEVVGPKSSLKLSILGPVRPETQVELAKTDARTLGIDAPLRDRSEASRAFYSGAGRRIWCDGWREHRHQARLWRAVPCLRRCGCPCQPHGWFGCAY